MMDKTSLQKYMKVIYESIMIILVMLTIITLWTENTYNSIINWIVWGIFFVDFWIRLFLAEKKWNFLKQNPFLVIAIIPFDQFFQVARIVRLIYLFRIKTITKYYISPFVDRLTYRSRTMILTIIISILFFSAFVIWMVEQQLVSYVNSIYVVFSHLLFFGRHMFEVDSSISILILTGTTILGIILQGLALQWVFTKAEALFKKESSEDSTLKM